MYTQCREGTTNNDTLRAFKGKIGISALGRKSTSRQKRQRLAMEPPYSSVRLLEAFLKNCSIR